MKRKITEVESTELKHTNESKQKVLKVNKFNKNSKIPNKWKGNKPNKPAANPDFVEGEKPKWAEIKKKHKDATQKRKLQRNSNLHHELSEAKKLFEVIRNSQSSPDVKSKNLKKLCKVLKGNLGKMVMRHDMARIVQWVVKLGSEEMKDDIVNEVINDVALLAQNKYSNHIIKCILKQCKAPIRRKIIRNCYGNIVKLVNNKLSAAIIEDLYTNYAVHEEKIQFKKELYGDLVRNLDFGKDSTLKAILNSNESLRPTILSNMKNLLTKLLNKQWAFTSNLIMSVVYEYLENCEEKEKLDLIELLRTNISLLIKTKCGAAVGILIVWHATAKIKKELIKELKSDLKNIAMTEPGSMFILTLIDSVDDTVLLKKALLPSIVENAAELIENEYGKRVILYLVAHRDPHFFHPSYLEQLKKADTSVNVKKSSTQRMTEIRDACLTPILGQIKDNPKLWLSNGSLGLITSAILSQASGSELAETHKSIVDLLIDSENTITVDGKTLKLIEAGGVHKTIKQMIKNDKLLNRSLEESFSHLLAENLSTKVLAEWLNYNRGCFTIVFLLETEIDKVCNKLKKKLQKIDVTEKLRNSDTKGASLLLEKLQTM